MYSSFSFLIGVSTSIPGMGVSADGEAAIVACKSAPRSISAEAAAFVKKDKIGLEILINFY